MLSAFVSWSHSHRMQSNCISTKDQLTYIESRKVPKGHPCQGYLCEFPRPHGLDLPVKNMIGCHLNKCFSFIDLSSFLLWIRREPCQHFHMPLGRTVTPLSLLCQTKLFSGCLSTLFLRETGFPQSSGLLEFAGSVTFNSTEVLEYSVPLCLGSISFSDNPIAELVLA